MCCKLMFNILMFELLHHRNIWINIFVNTCHMSLLNTGTSYKQWRTLYRTPLPRSEDEVARQNMTLLLTCDDRCTLLP